MPLPVWKGSTELTEQPGSPLYELDAYGPKYTRVWKGPHATCMANIPARLSTISGTTDDFSVDKVKVEKAPGGLGIMTVSLLAFPIQDYTFSENQLLEIEYQEIQRPLLTHPTFNPASANVGTTGAGDNDLTDPETQNLLIQYENGDANQKNAVYATAPTDFPELRTYLNLVRAGVTSYVLYAPVCRKTTKNAAPPDMDCPGYIATPPGYLDLAGTIFLYTANRLTYDHGWNQVQEWTGAQSIAILLYPS